MLPKALVLDAFQRLWNEGDETAVAERYHPSHVLHDPVYHLELLGWEGILEVARRYRAAFPNTRFDIEDHLAEGDRVATRWTVRGTHLGSLLGIPPTGRQIVVSGISIARLEAGLIAETWVSWDALGLLHQIGKVGELRGVWV